MAVKPQVILLDEAFSALDEYLKTQMIKEMTESLKKFSGITLFVTHNIQEAYRLCNRIVFLNNGRVETIGSKEEVFQRPATRETAKITGCKNIARAVRKSEHSAEIPDWGIRAATAMSIDNPEGFIGIRANHIKLADESVQENCCPVWIADESDAPFTTTLYLKIGSAPSRLDDYHIQWEMRRDQRAELSNLAQPIRIFMDPEKVFFMAK
jgi:ABC-type sulfate/molybdate transport systems ATPase subunit